jgi:capsular polysaccharide biosynthesis protein/Mrp family chromosome partitioning ATPase
MSASDDFSFSERSKRARPQVDAPPPGGQSPPPEPEFRAPPPRDPPPPPPQDLPPPPRDFAPPPDPTPRRKSAEDDEEEFELPVDPWRLVSALRARWRWLLIAGGGMLVLGALAGYFLSNYKVAVTLIQRDVTAPFEAGTGGEVFKPKPLAKETLISLMSSPQLMQRVSAQARPFISARALQKVVSLLPERNTELVHVILAGQDREQMIELVNLYAAEAVRLTREVQIEELSRTLRSYQQKVQEAAAEMSKAEAELQAFREQHRSFNPEAEAAAYDKQFQDYEAKIAEKRLDIDLIDLQLTNSADAIALQSPLTERIERAQEELQLLLSKYTEAHPEVQSKRLAIARLEQERASALTNRPAGGTRELELRARRASREKEIVELEKLRDDLRVKALAVSENVGRWTLIRSQLFSNSKKLEILRARLAETQYYHDNADGYYRVFAPATFKDIDTRSRWLKLLVIALGGLVVGVLGAAAVVVVLEVADDRLKTAADLRRVTGLPVLATLGDLNQMSPAEKEAWAFRTWTALSGQLSRSANHGMVCGFISSTAGEGRSTWINLLVEAASQRGLRVLTISTRPSPQDLDEMDRAAEESEKEFSEAVAQAVTESAPQLPATAVMMTAQALAFPAQVSQKFTGPDALPSAHIALPGWVWNLERRRQFQRALAHWRSLDSMVLLVELPPASVPEAVLLAENLPQLVWLADSGKPRARATREQLQTLRHARCRLVGAVLNHEPKPVLKP